MHLSCVGRAAVSILACGLFLLGAAESPGNSPEMAQPTMKAVRIHSYGGPGVLTYEDAPRPAPGPGEILIRVHAAAVNPVDWKVTRGGLRDLGKPLPYITGFDAAGVVESLGEGATRFKPGDEVYVYQELTRGGAYAEYMTVKQEHAARKPEGVSFEEAAAVPLAALTAWQALFDTAGLQPSQTVLVHGAAGGVGHFAVQLAKAKGARVIGTASERNHEFLRSLGCDEVIDYRSVRFEDAVKDADVVLDAVGGETLERSYGVVKKGGVLVTIAGHPSEEKARRHGIRAEWILVQPSGEQLAEIGGLIAAGKVRPVVSEVIPLAEARRAHELSQTGHTRGKIVLSVRP